VKNLEIISVNISEKKGTKKNSVSEIELDFGGVLNDAHYGMKNRQVSLLAQQEIEKFEIKAGRKIANGEFGENIDMLGLDYTQVNLLDRFIIGEAVLEITQIGKRCHGSACDISREVGDCIMPKQGLFCRVIKGAKIKAGDIAIYQPKVFNVKIITVSDRASKGEYADKTGPKIADAVLHYFASSKYKVIANIVVLSDDLNLIQTEIKEAVREGADIIFTNGGTGVGARDITPEAVIPLLSKQIPGIMEMIRLKFGKDFPKALLSRGVAGVIGKSLIYTLPGSLNAVNDYLSEIFKTMEHLVFMIYELDVH